MTKSEQYRVETTGIFSAASMIGDGYDVMEAVEKFKWYPVPSWGKEGYLIGDWPYSIVFRRAVKHEDDVTSYEVADYTEGDVTMYKCLTEAEQIKVIDEIAFAQWKWLQREWVKEYKSVEDLPQELRGGKR